MQNLSKLSKIFLYICSLSGILWLGGYLSRLLLTYQLFEPRDFILKPYVTDQNLGGIFFTLNSSVTFTLILYIIFLVTFVLFLLTSGIKLKEEGWLFVILLIIIVTAPFELYLMSFDYKIATQVFYTAFVPKDILGIYIKRMKVLSSFPLIEIFSYCAIIFLAIFKPLRMKKVQ
ncbi:MAG: hypothetical protein ACM3S2_18755 [Ignavibacteriales bacterium]